jgi:hypothetical protein
MNIIIMKRRSETQKRRVIRWDELTYKPTSIDDVITDLKRNDYCIREFGAKARHIILPTIKEDEEYKDGENISRQYPYVIDRVIKPVKKEFWYEL